MSNHGIDRGTSLLTQHMSSSLHTLKLPYWILTTNAIHDVIHSVSTRGLSIALLEWRYCVIFSRVNVSSFKELVILLVFPQLNRDIMSPLSKKLLYKQQSMNNTKTPTISWFLTWLPLLFRVLNALMRPAAVFSDIFYFNQSNYNWGSEKKRRKNVCIHLCIGM